MQSRKFLYFAAIVCVLVGVAVASWAYIEATEPRVQETVRDAAMDYIEVKRSETAQFMNNLVWNGGKEETNLLGAETYKYTSQGWQITIKYPVIANPSYEITADYSVTPKQGDVSIPYRIIWQGNWENGVITETNYTFAQ